MARFDSKKDYNGHFIPHDGAGAGHLVVAGKDSLLTLVGKEPWSEIDEEYSDQHGYLNDGTKVSLLECIRTGQTNHRWGDDAHYELALFPHYTPLTSEPENLWVI